MASNYSDNMNYKCIQVQFHIVQLKPRGLYRLAAMATFSARDVKGGKWNVDTDEELESCGRQFY